MNKSVYLGILCVVLYTMSLGLPGFSAICSTPIPVDVEARKAQNEFYKLQLHKRKGLGSWSQANQGNLKHTRSGRCFP